MRLKQSAAVAGALVDRDDLYGHFSDVGECELSLTVGSLAANQEPPLRLIDLGNMGEMIADKERVIRRGCANKVVLFMLPNQRRPRAGRARSGWGVSTWPRISPSG